MCIENVESFKYLGSILTNNGRSTCEIKCRIVMAKAAFNKMWTFFTSTFDLELRKKLVKCYIWSIALYGAEIWMLRSVDQKHLESFEMWYWKRIEKISWTDQVHIMVRNEEVLLRVKEQRNILHEIRKRKAKWIVHILRKNCLLQQVTEGKIKGGIEVTKRRGRRGRKLFDNLKERR
jgi:hypothetical protein